MIRREIEVDKDYEFVFRFFSNGLQEVPSSASVVVYNKSGTEITSDNCSIEESTGDCSFTFTAALNVTKSRNFKLAVTRNTDGETRYYYELFDVVAVPLQNLCSDETLYDKVEELRKNLFEKVYKTSEVGGVNELRSLQLVEDTRDYTGGYLQIFLGGGVMHNARITDYERSSGSCIFYPAYTAAIPTATTFRVRPSFQRKIDDAFESHVKRDVRNVLGIASRIIDSNLIVNLTAYKTLELYCLSQIENEGDKWALRMVEYRKLYQGEMSSLQESSDLDDDGNISDSEDEQKINLSMAEVVR